ncbi:hypothetical protein AG1IA_03956 [Rhizoctonia solani AG-1 IA]|uniref:Uncharacterized protein n=1 Tax=Thanatephorus cucumeris (strain AG1-IA) TaxID=983506 RepID=L8WYX2_THACA|nr:hypothetical protein AG1IA_03956 [Rhizoctonia solani AG-1 IA]
MSSEQYDIRANARYITQPTQKQISLVVQLSSARRSRDVGWIWVRVVLCDRISLDRYATSNSFVFVLIIIHFFGVYNMYSLYERYMRVHYDYYSMLINGSLQQ